MPIGCLSLFVAMVLMLVMPFVYADLMQAALLKLQISPQAAALVVGGIFVGSLINIPVKRA